MVNWQKRGTSETVAHSPHCAWTSTITLACTLPDFNYLWLTISQRANGRVSHLRAPAYLMLIWPLDAALASFSMAEIPAFSWANTAIRIGWLWAIAIFYSQKLIPAEIILFLKHYSLSYHFHLNQNIVAETLLFLYWLENIYVLVQIIIFLHLPAKQICRTASQRNVDR